jgi:hypothetical protein
MISQVFDFSVDLLQALLWQYNEAEALQSLLKQKQDWYDTNQTQFWNDWYINVFNLQTANDFGCAVWSIILNLPLEINANPDPPGKPIFGFATEGGGPFNHNFNFGHGNFSNGGTNSGLNLAEKRLVLKLRYFTLVTRGAVMGVMGTNAFLKFVFSDPDLKVPSFGKAYILDRLDMSMRIVFTWNPGAKLLDFIKKFDLIPRPAAVELDYIVDIGKIFGFASETATPNGFQNFGHGTFINEDG